MSSITINKWFTAHISPEWVADSSPSWNSILDKAQSRFEVTFTEEMTPSTRTIHDLISKLYQEAEVRADAQMHCDPSEMEARQMREDEVEEPETTIQQLEYQNDMEKQIHSKEMRVLKEEMEEWKLAVKKRDEAIDHESDQGLNVDFYWSAIED